MNKSIVMYMMVGGPWRTEIFSTLKIIANIPIKRFERGVSRMPFAYSLPLLTDLLENFQEKSFYFQNQFSPQYHISLYMVYQDYVPDYIKKPWSLSLYVVWYS